MITKYFQFFDSVQYHSGKSQCYSWESLEQQILVTNFATVFRIIMSSGGITVYSNEIFVPIKKNKTNKQNQTTKIHMQILGLYIPTLNLEVCFRYLIPEMRTNSSEVDSITTPS